MKLSERKHTYIAAVADELASFGELPDLIDLARIFHEPRMR